MILSYFKSSCHVLQNKQEVWSWTGSDIWSFHDNKNLEEDISGLFWGNASNSPAEA